MQERHRVVPTVHLIVEKQGKILLQRPCNTGWQDGYYCPVAGHVEAGETIRKAMRREAKEEAGIDVSLKDLHVVYVLHRKGHDYERLDFFLEAKKWRGNPMIAEPQKCDELGWFFKNRLPIKTVPYVKKAFRDMKKGLFYGENNWAVK